jgi:NAD(P)-dependent dehydrogenase (short-subunit alcohol dehydrogenase family)
MDQNLLGKPFVVTGATSGIGFSAAQALAGQGASVIGTGRSIERSHQAQIQINRFNPDNPSIYLTGDLSLQSQVRALAESIQELLLQSGKNYLDGLVNNAGTFSNWQNLSPEGFETQWAVNHLAPFLLTLKLIPLLKAAPYARIITVNSGSHSGTHLNWEDIQLHRHYEGLRAYSQTKLANILFTCALNTRLAGCSTVRAFAVDPGLVKTDIGLKGTSILVQRFWKVRRAMGIPPEMPARGIVSMLEKPASFSSSENY